MQEIINEKELHEALRQLFPDPPQLPADFAQRVYEAAQRQRRRRNLRRIVLWPSMAAAACIAVAFLVVVPRIRESRELSRYEGSYAVVEGQRIEDLSLIKEDISEALAMAEVAEEFNEYYNE